MDDSAATLAPSIEETLVGGSTFPPKDAPSGVETPTGGDAELAPGTALATDISRSASPADSMYAHVAILKGDPSERDPTEIPLVAFKLPGSTPATLWAKADTGADFNIIARRTVEKLGRASLLRSVTNLEEHKTYEMGGNIWGMTHSIRLHFLAGTKNRDIVADFWIPEERAGVDTDNDKLPDVLLGWELLRDNHMVMVDLDYHNEPNPEYEVLAKRAWEEGNPGEERKKILVTKHSSARPSPYGPGSKGR